MSVNCYYLVSVSEKIIGGPHGILDPPSLAQITSEMKKAADAADISVLFFSDGANLWATLGHFGAIWEILGHFWAILGNFGSFFGHFLVLIFFGQKCNSVFFITFCISAL